MLRGILQVIFVFFFLRLLFWFLRLVTAGSRADADAGRTSGRESAVQRRKTMRVDPSNVTDVPFTEIPAETTDPMRPETKPAERVEAL